MKLLNHRFLICGILTLSVFPFIVCSQSKRPQPSATSIFISEQFPEDAVRFNSGEFQRKLKSLLRIGGILTPDASADADAELLTEVSVSITLHGTIDDKDIMIYECRLMSKSGKRLWRNKQRFVSKKTQSENDEFAARRIAETFLTAWKDRKIQFN